MNFKNQFNIKSLKKWRKVGIWIAVTIASLLILITLALPAFQWVIDYIWLDTLGYGAVYTTILSSKILLGVIGFLLFGFAIYITLFWIRRSYIGHFDPGQLPPFILKGRTSNFIIISIAIFIGILGSLIVQGIGWEPALKFLNYSNFNISDPHFDMDVSFFVFVLPFIKIIIFILLSLSIFILLLEIGFYSAFNMYRMSRQAQLHMGMTLGIIGLLISGLHFLAPYETLLGDQVNIFQKSVVHGLSYTDKLINIPKSYALAIVALLGTVWMIVSLFRNKLESVITPILIYVVFIIIGQGASIIVQNYVVSPNEFVKESPYLEHNLNFTRTAYGLDEESIKVEDHPGNFSLNEEMIERNRLTIDNVRLNDTRPLLDIYNQLQTFRTYYKFNDMDIDRYEIDGEYEQVFIGARELNTDNLPSQAKTWVNQKLRYTHGYGIAMSHVNTVNKQGQPEYMMKNIPPEGVLDVTRPQIYFGEEPYPNVIVNTKVDEFDYPTGDENESHRFEGDTGIPLKGINRLLFAIDEKSFRMLVSDQLTDESQFLATRNIMDRVNRIAPFFEYDNDPYIFVREDGSLAWILDAYLSAENYPYSEPHKKRENYIRNSVKVVMDAYTGEVTFYIVDPEDPLLKTYENIFPSLFTKEVPEDIQSHFRYPEKLFSIQAEMYGTYHMSNLEIFYNREDFWQFPTEKYYNKDIVMDPYYITMKLPENDEEEFILMMPYTPNKRQNMISWMGVRNDGDHYGEIFVYQFPKQKNIYGPQQIENRINQDSVISQQLNLWAQGGSEVIRGNLLAIPIEDTILYVEPIYIESSNETSLPEVKQVVMAYEDHIVMEETFEKSLEEILSMVDPEHESKETEDDDLDELEEKLESIEEDLERGNTDEDETADPTDPILDSTEMLNEFAELFNAYKEALAKGDWEESGKILKEIEQELAKLE